MDWLDILISNLIAFIVWLFFVFIIFFIFIVNRRNIEKNIRFSPSVG